MWKQESGPHLPGVGGVGHDRKGPARNESGKQDLRKASESKNLSTGRVGLTRFDATGVRFQNGIFYASGSVRRDKTVCHKNTE